MYTFEINGKIFPLKDGFVVREELNEKIDSAVIVCNTDEVLDIEPFDKVTIYGDDGFIPKTFLVDNFIENITQFTPKRKYEYEINLFSETKYLERITLPSLSITTNRGVKRSVAFYIQRFLDEYLPKIKVKVGGLWEYQPKFAVDARLIEKFNSVDCPEFSWNDPTLKEVLDDLLMVDDCIVLVRNNIITYYDLRKKGNGINYFEHLNNAQRSMASSDYLTDLTITMKNAIGKNLNVSTEYQGARSEGGELTTNNMVIMTNHPIYSIKSLKVCFLLLYTPLETHVIENKYVYYELDISKYVKEEDEYAILNPNPPAENISDEYQWNCLSYKRGDNKIMHLTDEHYSVTTLQRILHNIIFSTPSIYHRIEGYTPSEYVGGGINDDPRDDYVYLVEYETLAERKLKVGKYLPSKNAINEVFDNQSSSYVDIQQQSIFEYAKANRLGNEIYMIYGQYYNEADIPQIGDNLKDKILFSREISYYDGYMLFKGTLTKNYVLKNYFTGIQSKRRSWQIAKGNEALTRYDITKLYGEFSFHQKNDIIPFLGGLNGQIDYNQDIFRHLLAPIAPISGVKGIKNAVVLTKSGDSNFPQGASGYELELNSEVQGRSICFNFGYNDNYSVGTYVVKDGNARLNGIYKYADLNGEFDTMVIKLLSSIDKNTTDFTFPSNAEIVPDGKEFSYKLKLAEIGRTKPQVYFTQTDLDNIQLSLHLNNFYKDNREIIKYTFQIEFCSDSENIVVTDYFVQSQRIVRDGAFIVPLKIYTIPFNNFGVNYKVDDTSALGNDHTDDYKLVASYADGVTKRSIKLTLVYKGAGVEPKIRGWGIANQWGILLLGVNVIGLSTKPIYFNILSNRNDNVYNNAIDQVVVGKMWEDLANKK